jgi:hypothetical protein
MLQTLANITDGKKAILVHVKAVENRSQQQKLFDELL